MGKQKAGFYPVAHTRFKWVQKEIFEITFVRDCMTHSCHDLKNGGHQRNDACCQHGADVNLFERDAILKLKDKIATLIAPEYRDPNTWFDESNPSEYSDFPSGKAIRTNVSKSTEFEGRGESGCVFLFHADDSRGCVIHRAILENNLALDGIKPHICRLFPVTYDDDTLFVTDDIDWYDCSHRKGGPTIFDAMRPTLNDVFGQELVHAMEAARNDALPTRGLGKRTIGRRLPLVD